MPFYLVKTPNEEKIVDAVNAAQAIRHVVQQTITAKALTAKEIVAQMQSGKTVETASSEG